MQAWIYGKVRFLILTSKMSYQQVKQVKNRLIHMVIHIIHRILPTKRLFCGTESQTIKRLYNRSITLELYWRVAAMLPYGII